MANRIRVLVYAEERGNTTGYKCCTFIEDNESVFDKQIDGKYTREGVVYDTTRKLPKSGKNASWAVPASFEVFSLKMLAQKIKEGAKMRCVKRWIDFSFYFAEEIFSVDFENNLWVYRRRLNPEEEWEFKVSLLEK